ncbi:unnamed protein product [Acanthoscelides obtectus]|uniref:Uncharacterized protein n=1 Tax=Acanthoscelides obtectus TaxID=200917 RepID=A0A9P0P5M2_ACAOB|nr:unnamed protein product [Acanthoscelides obtectus]CAK1633528.1 hypothetical protein AOBTE_LOCUS8198 [Acanthoscelides obtectus]
MSMRSFDELLTLCRYDLLKQDTILRKSVSPEEKLFVTLSIVCNNYCLFLNKIKMPTVGRCVGLTEEEEKHLLMLLQGDESDLDCVTDNDEDDFDQETFLRLQEEYDPYPPEPSPEELVLSNSNLEVDTDKLSDENGHEPNRQMQQDFDPEDDLPIITFRN